MHQKNVNTKVLLYSIFSLFIFRLLRYFNYLTLFILLHCCTSDCDNKYIGRLVHKILFWLTGNDEFTQGECKLSQNRAKKRSEVDIENKVNGNSTSMTKMSPDI